MVFRCSIGIKMNYFGLKIIFCCSKVPGQVFGYRNCVHYLLLLSFGVDVLYLVLVLWYVTCWLLYFSNNLAEEENAGC